MGFEVIHQPKSNAVFFFREILWQKCLFFFCLFRVSASAFSVFFRVRPWLILLLYSYPCFCFCFFRVFPCSSVAKTNRPMERSPWALKSFINPNRMQFFFPCHSVANSSASASASALCFFRVSASAFSVFFRVIPWLILLLYSYPCSSVANASSSA